MSTREREDVQQLLGYKQTRSHETLSWYYTDLPLNPQCSHLTPLHHHPKPMSRFGPQLYFLPPPALSSAIQHASLLSLHMLIWGIPGLWVTVWTVTSLCPPQRAVGKECALIRREKRKEMEKLCVRQWKGRKRAGKARLAGTFPQTLEILFLPLQYVCEWKKGLHGNRCGEETPLSQVIPWPLPLTETCAPSDQGGQKKNKKKWGFLMKL